MNVNPCLFFRNVVENDSLQGSVGPLTAHQLNAGPAFPEALEGQIAAKDQDEAEHERVDLVDVRVLKDILKVGRLRQVFVQFEQGRQNRRERGPR